MPPSTDAVASAMEHVPRQFPHQTLLRSLILVGWGKRSQARAAAGVKCDGLPASDSWDACRRPDRASQGEPAQFEIEP